MRDIIEAQFAIWTELPKFLDKILILEVKIIPVFEKMWILEFDYVVFIWCCFLIAVVPISSNVWTNRVPPIAIRNFMNSSRSPIYTQISFDLVSFHICINSLTFVFLCPFVFHQVSDDFPVSWNFDHKSYNMIRGHREGGPTGFLKKSKTPFF